MASAGFVLVAGFSPLLLPALVVWFSGLGPPVNIAGHQFWRLVCYILMDLLIAYTQLGLLRYSLTLHDRSRVDFRDLASDLAQFLYFLLAHILYSAIVTVGLILFIVPGIVWAVQFQFFGLCIVDQGLGPIDALRRSSEITRGSRWQLFGLNLLTIVIGLFGFLCLVVGLIPAVSIRLVSLARAYRSLTGDKNCINTASE